MASILRLEVDTQIQEVKRNLQTQVVERTNQLETLMKWAKQEIEEIEKLQRIVDDIP